MKNKKLITFFIILFFLPISFYLIFIKPNRTRLVETFLRSFPKKEFYSKLKSSSPKWMDDQIKEDFKDFYKNSITMYSIDRTFEKINKSAPSQKKAFIRYRIIDNKLYRYFPKNSELTKKEPSFEKAVKTLCKLVKLPDLDFIYSDMDGTPESYMKKDFYIVENQKNQSPIFSRCKVLNNPFIVLIPDYYSVNTAWKKEYIKILDDMKNYSWTDKTNLAFWRGGSHDGGYNLTNYKTKPRVIISMLSKKYPNLIDAGINETLYMQFKEILKKENLIKPMATIEEHLKYKYLPVLDGYVSTYPGYQWRLLSNCVCFKQKSNAVQWFYLALRPYEHYIPIENDMSDLLEKINWAQKNDETCKKIAKNATDFVLNNLLLEDVYIYLNKVLNSYALYLCIDKKDLINSTLSDPEWICIQQRKKANKAILKRKLSEK
jgi:hypothetical protein